MADTPPKKVSAKPEAELVPRRQDEILTSDELQLLDLFGNLNKRLSAEKFPGSIVLRRFRQGEVVCRQGDQGHSAFYIVRSQDMQALRAARGQAAAEAPAAATAAAEEEAGQPRQVATAYLLGGPQVAKQPAGLVRRLFAKAAPARRKGPDFIPNDGPTDVDYHTRQAPMLEGDVFGEMSCMTLSPRSATVVVTEDCFMVEFQRNIFDQMQKDDGYRQRIDELYQRRVLSAHLRRLEFFGDLDDAQLEVLRQAAHLEVVDPGTVICAEGQRSDSVYVIRSGVVQVVHGAVVTLARDDVADWEALCRALLPDAAGAGQPPAQDKAAAKSPAGGAAVADILAAARGAGGKKSAAEKPAPAADKPPAADKAPPVDQPPAADKPPAAPPASPADVLQAAREGGKKPAAKPGPAGKSAAEILALAKKPRAASAAGAAGDATGDAGDRLLAARLPQPSGDARRTIWSCLAAPTQAALRRIAADPAAANGDRDLLVRALNELIRWRDFVAHNDVLQVLAGDEEASDTIRAFPKGTDGVKKDWAEVEVRMAGILALRALCPQAFKPRKARKGPPHILAYLTRGDCFGEMALVLGQPRQATCIAYDHPSDDPRRKPGRVELVRIEAAAFRQLLDASPGLNTSVQQLVDQRRQEIMASEDRRPWESWHSLVESEEFRDEGFVQGQKLLLIDLDLCTRCGDCVRACVNTHDDGHSRLFLDGPRFDRFLVPSACRQCLNPACMIGCPVGSIQRGANGQIEIRDWCIGCGLCARQCPYDSIQMHDVGIIPESTAGWQFAPASKVGARNWQARGFRPRGWAVAATPFLWTLDLAAQLADLAADDRWSAAQGRLVEPLCFRYRFHVSHEQRDHEQFRLYLVSEGLAVQGWLNGASLSWQQDAKQKKKGEFEARLDRKQLRRGWNVLAVEARPPEPGGDDGGYAPNYNQRLLSARLDPLPQAGAVTAATAGADASLEVELVTEKAVVCDLCSSIPGGPACVAQCPHDAAIRVNARFEFPTL